MHKLIWCVVGKPVWYYHLYILFVFRSLISMHILLKILLPPPHLSISSIFICHSIEVFFFKILYVTIASVSVKWPLIGQFPLSCLCWILSGLIIRTLSPSAHPLVIDSLPTDVGFIYPEPCDSNKGFNLWT